MDCKRSRPYLHSQTSAESCSSSIVYFKTYDDIHPGNSADKVQLPSWHQSKLSHHISPLGSLANHHLPCFHCKPLGIKLQDQHWDSCVTNSFWPSSKQRRFEPHYSHKASLSLWAWERNAYPTKEEAFVLNTNSIKACMLKVQQGNGAVFFPLTPLCKALNRQHIFPKRIPYTTTLI